MTAIRQVLISGDTENPDTGANIHGTEGQRTTCVHLNRDGGALKSEITINHVRTFSTFIVKLQFLQRS